MKLRPQVAVWERAVPAGAGITGLWRPTAAVAAAATGQSDGPRRRQRRHGLHLPPGRERSYGLGGIVRRRRFRRRRQRRAGRSKTARSTAPTSRSGRGPRPTRARSTASGLNCRGPAALPGRGGRGGADSSRCRRGGPAPGHRPAAAGSDPSFGAGGGGRGGAAGQAPAPLILRRVTR